MNGPRVSVGMPLYNAERFLAQTLDSILGQSFRDFEVVLSDNGSTDRTEQICREYAAKDSRIRYYRNEVNRGAAWNHNRVFELSRGEYFKWNSYDDLLAPEFLERCVAELDRDHSVVLCCSKVMDIDGGGQSMTVKGSKASTCAQPHERFRALIHKAHTCEEIYGLMRSEILKRTPLIGAYTSSDQNLLAELALHGQFREVPEVLFFHRWHEASSYTLWPDGSARWLWFDPSAKGRILFPRWKQLFEFVKSVRRVPVSRLERARCYRHLIWWMNENRGVLRGDLYWGGRAMIIRFLKAHIPWIRTAYRAVSAPQGRS
jgi:glycosyltransferase involved in cell wall biosynthesis